MRLCAHAVGITAPLKHGGNAATNRGPERPDDPTAWLQGKTTLARKAAANRWKRPLNDPIPLPRGRQLVTLEDAGDYIIKLQGLHCCLPLLGLMLAFRMILVRRRAGRRCSHALASCKR